VGISITDSSVWILARERRAILLTGDSKLRRHVQRAGVEVRGVLWVLGFIREDSEAVSRHGNAWMEPHVISFVIGWRAFGDIRNRSIGQPVFVMKMAGSAGSQRKRETVKRRWSSPKSSSCACDICHNHEAEIALRPKHCQGKIHCVGSGMSETAKYSNPHTRLPPPSTTIMAPVLKRSCMR